MSMFLFFISMAFSQDKFLAYLQQQNVCYEDEYLDECGSSLDEDSCEDPRLKKPEINCSYFAGFFNFDGSMTPETEECLAQEEKLKRDIELYQTCVVTSIHRRAKYEICVAQQMQSCIKEAKINFGYMEF